MITVDITGLKDVLTKIQTLQGPLHQNIYLAFQAGMELVKNHAKYNHPAWPVYLYNPDGTWRYHNITSNLSGSIGFRMRNATDSIESDVGALNELFKGNAMQYANKIERDHPYVGPAVEAQWQNWINLISKAIINTLK
jgi:hypothetical protein